MRAVVAKGTVKILTPDFKQSANIKFLKVTSPKNSA
jgi:hypothetical protein